MNEEEAEKSETAKREEETLKFWQKNEIFKKTLEKKSPKGEFVFYDGPPFATGLPHYGSLLASIAKDVFGRYKTMQGYHVRRRWGWDCHGLPIENMIEKRLGLKSKKDIETMGIEKFNEICRSAVLETAGDWKKYIERIGRWVDFDNSYKTMDNDYIESVWWALKQIWDKGLLYEGRKVLMYCPRCETPLAKAEVAMDNSYKTATVEAITVKFKLKPGQKIGNWITDESTYILAWTTTPWTLPGNIALAVNSDVGYCLIGNNQNQEKYILAKSISATLKIKYKILKEFNGGSLSGLTYEPLYEILAVKNSGKKSHHVIRGGFVTDEEGTGVVHINPMHGEDDYDIGVKYDLPVIPLLDQGGRFNNDAPEFIRGFYLKKGEKYIKEDLEKKGLLFAKHLYAHSYPHCHRCETPLYYSALSSWFINIQKIKNRLVQLNEKINWQPEHIKHGRFLNIVESAPDWNISRNRYWASPLPIWKCQKCKEVEVIGSLKELEEKTKSSDVPLNKNLVLDLHRPYIDKIVFDCQNCGGKMLRTTEVLDSWFESSSMPFAEYHYPFENKEQFEKRFPGDFMAEYIAQTRTWFYYMHVIASALFGDIGFKNVVTTGNILAEDGGKMSKSKGNYTDPMSNMDKYSADALRFYMMASAVMRSEDVRFEDSRVKEAQLKVVNILWNTFKFFDLYQKDYDGKTAAENSGNVLDKWILARFCALTSGATENMDNYNTVKASGLIQDFIDDFSVWHLRRSRDRVKGEGAADKQFALATMKFVLLELAKIIAPFMPFLAEDIYRGAGGEKKSVHTEDWSSALLSGKLKTCLPDKQTSEELIEDMNEVRKIVSLGLEARAKAGIKVRQPLALLKIKSNPANSGINLKDKEGLLKLIRDELNVKEVVFDDEIVNEVELDAKLTEELKEEGGLRELVRALQDMRKKAGLSPRQKIVLQIAVNPVVQKFLEKFEGEIKKTAGIEKFEAVSDMKGGQEIKINDKILRFKILDLRF